MRKASVALHVLAVIGFVALSATVAYAGGGQGGGSNILNAWQCYLINGEQPPFNVLNIADQFGARENVHVGKARLLCAPMTAWKPDQSNFGSFVFGDHITCYSVSPFDGPRLFNPDAVVDLTDELNTDTGVKVSIPAFLCTLADKTCASGTQCGLEVPPGPPGP